MTQTAQTLTDFPVDAVPAFPMPRAAGCPFDPPPGMTALRSARPVSTVRMWDGRNAWLITDYEHARALLADPRVSSDTTQPNYPFSSPGLMARRKQSRTFINMDNPEHQQLRRMVTSSFSIRRVEQMRPRIQAIVDGLIDDMLSGPNPCDLVQALALPVPSLIICELLGVPYEDREFFHHNTKTLVSRTATPDEAMAAQQALLDYLGGLITTKKTQPGDDVLTRLSRRVENGELSQREAADMASLLLVAGHETTANMIALGTAALLQHPEQLAELQKDEPDPATVAASVEELLRYLTIVHNGRSRVALADITVGDVTIAAGDPLIIASDTANRDATAFADPDRLDIHRDARRHVAFGYGVHQCLGQPLARVELQVVYATLYRRIPTLRLATDLEQLPFKHESAVYGLHELPVAW